MLLIIKSMIDLDAATLWQFVTSWLAALATQQAVASQYVTNDGRIQRSAG
jgi:hypothetical protein